MNISFFQKRLPRRILLAAGASALLVGCAVSSQGAPETADAPAASTMSETESTAKPPKVGDTAPDFELDALNGGKVKLSEMVEKGPIVLVMLRGFPGYQCPICTIQVAQLLGKSKELAAAKANVLLVYPGPAEGLKAHAAEFVQGKDIP